MPMLTTMLIDETKNILESFLTKPSCDWLDQAQLTKSKDVFSRFDKDTANKMKVEDLSASLKDCLTDELFQKLDIDKIKDEFDSEKTGTVS